MGTKYRFGEDQIVKEALDYIESTYAGHYVGHAAGEKDEDIQTIDVWRTLGIEAESCQSNILKYIMRYGKKDGFNKKDLLKVIHYTVLLWHFTQNNKSKTDEEKNDEAYIGY